MRHITTMPVLVAVSLLAFAASAFVDTDNDGYEDYEDNCSAVANAGQEDADGDGFGNRCDADLDNDCAVGIPDFGIFKRCINLPGQGARRQCLIADFNSDHKITSLDFQLFEEMFAIGFPGPSGLVETCE